MQYSRRRKYHLAQSSLSVGILPTRLWIPVSGRGWGVGYVCLLSINLNISSLLSQHAASSSSSSPTSRHHYPAPPWVHFSQYLSASDSSRFFSSSSPSVSQPLVPFKHPAECCWDAIFSVCEATWITERGGVVKRTPAPTHTNRIAVVSWENCPCAVWHVILTFIILGAGSVLPSSLLHSHLHRCKFALPSIWLVLESSSSSFILVCVWEAGAAKFSDFPEM